LYSLRNHSTNRTWWNDFAYLSELTKLWWFQYRAKDELLESFGVGQRGDAGDIFTHESRLDGVLPLFLGTVFGQDVDDSKEVDQGVVFRKQTTLMRLIESEEPGVSFIEAVLSNTIYVTR
jgi:hypothetical protein